MRIVDGDTHISPTKESSVSIGYPELIDQMDQAGVDQALTWLQPPYRRETDAANQYVYEAVRAHPDRLLGFGWADPNLGRQQALDTVKRCTQDFGFYGIKLNGAQNSFYIDDPELSLPVIEAIAKAGTILAFHIGADAFDHTHPFRAAKIAERFPELPILMVHMGGVGHHDISQAVIEYATQHKNMMLIGSAVRSRAIVKAIDVLGPKRVCFGSDTPFEYMRVAVARYKALLDGVVDSADQEAIMGQNLLSLLKEPR